MSMKIEKPNDFVKQIKMMEKFKNKVISKYPNALLTKDFDEDKLQNRLVVKVGDKVLQDEYFLPNSNDEFFSWYYASLSVKVTQQFNRTHPDKLIINYGDKIEKTKRIVRRKMNGKQTTKMRKEKKQYD